jgi:hypothetical protein
MVRIAQIEKSNINALGLLAISAQAEENFGWVWWDSKSQRFPMRPHGNAWGKVSSFDQLPPLKGVELLGISKSWPMVRVL